VDESDIAEKAAELIDDFYEEQEEEDSNAEEMLVKPSVNGQYQFQAPNPPNSRVHFFDFTN
jgi:hypothetical protein